MGLVLSVLLLSAPGLEVAQAGDTPQLGTLHQERAEVEILLALEDRRRSLDLRTQEVERKEERLKEAQAHLTAQLAEMAQLRTELDALIAEEARLKDKKYKEMASIHGSMPTARSAEILAAMDDREAVRIMANLPDVRVAKTLAKMPPERALTLSRAYMGLKQK